MKKIITLILCVILISTLLTACEFSNLNSLKNPLNSITSLDFKLPFMSKQLNLERINWDVKIKDIDKDYDKEGVHMLKERIDAQKALNNLMKNAGLSQIAKDDDNPALQEDESGSLAYSVSKDYDGIRKVTDQPVYVLYVFSEDEKLEEINFNLSLPYADEENASDIIDALKDIAKTVVTDYDNDKTATYFMHIGNCAAEVRVNKKDRRMAVTCKKTGFVKSAESYESTFSVNDIDWTMSRDEIMSLHQNKICQVNEYDKEDMALVYAFAGLDGIASEGDVTVCYYFNKDFSIKDIVIFFDNTNANWQNALNYFDADVTTEIKKTTVYNENTMAILDVKKDLDSLLIFAVPR